MISPKTHTHRKSAPRRNPQRTRGRLLQAAFGEIYKSGFQGTDLDTILRCAGVTKGALYHYFESKEALGYAIVEEVIASITCQRWLRPLEEAANPIDALIGIFQFTSVKPGDVRGGCPLNNLAQEMSPLDEGFRRRLEKVFNDWREAITTALREGQTRRLVRTDLDPKETATFLIALYEGYISLAKNSQDARMLQSGKRSIVRYLETLRGAENGRQEASSD